MDFLAQNYNWWRAGHIIFVIAWMAGLLYLPRLFIYHFQSVKGGELDLCLIDQERRLLRIIMNPAMVMTWVFGVLLIFSNAGRANGWIIFLSVPWAVKFILVSLMTGIHHWYALVRKRFANGERPGTQKNWRFLNEVPAVLAIFIVLTAVVWLR